MNNRDERNCDLISTKILLNEYFKEYDEFHLDLFLKFVDDNCKVYLLDGFSRKGTQMLNNFDIKTKTVCSKKEIDDSKNFSMIAVDFDKNRTSR